MNNVILMGRLTKDPELRQTPNGVANCRFTVAVNRRFKNQQTGEYEADFITCTAWRQTAEFITRYFKKGSMICVQGSIRTGSYQDKNHSDVTHYTTEVMVDNAEFTGSKSDSGTSGGGSGYNNYNNNNGYNYNTFQTPPQYAGADPGAGAAPYSGAPGAPADNGAGASYGSTSEYEEILSDGDVPF